MSRVGRFIWEAMPSDPDVLPRLQGTPASPPAACHLLEELEAAGAWREAGAGPERTAKKPGRQRPSDGRALPSAPPGACLGYCSLCRPAAQPPSRQEGSVTWRGGSTSWVPRVASVLAARFISISAYLHCTDYGKKKLFQL
jgi:hypothetical protein